MKHEIRQEPPELEPPLSELSRFRELSELEIAPKELKRAVFQRLRQTLTEDAPVRRRETRARTWLLGLGISVVVPSAFAATPAGSALLERTLDEWAPRVLELVFATPSRSRAGLGPSPTRPVKTVSSATPSAAAVLALPAPLASTRSLSAPDGVAQAAPREAPKGAHSGATRVEVTASNGSQQNNPQQTQPSGSLNAERRLLQGARLRLRAGDASGALALTSRHAELFPDGILAAERDAIIKQAERLKAGSQ